MVTREIIFLAFQVFSLQFPFSASDLKAAFRREAKRLHTDVSGDENTKEAFIQMKNAYDILTDYTSENGGELKIRETTDGTSVSELGLGLGPLKNGRDCPRCDHKGYTERRGTRFSVCTACDDNGDIAAVLTCNACHGTKRFTQRTGRVVDCRKCNGTGKFTHPRKKWLCLKCGGSKTIYHYNEGDVLYFVKCNECKGTGEIELFNPVLPKGLLAGMLRT